MRRIGLLLCALFLSGCVYSETVYLRNPTGMTVQCGPYRESFGDGMVYLESSDYSRRGFNPGGFNQRLQQCVEGYQRTGYSEFRREEAQ